MSARRRGFTLLELLLAVAMAAALGAALAAALHIGFRARSGAFARIAPAREAAIVLDVAQSDLQSVLPPTGTLSGPFVGRPSGGSEGEGDSLEFYALLRDPISDHETPLSEGPRRVELFLRTDEETGPNSGFLVRRVQRNLLAQTAAETEEENLARGVRALTFRYFDGEAWLSEWDSTAYGDALPRAVEMTIELASRDPRSDAPYRATQVIPLSIRAEIATTGLTR